MKVLRGLKETDCNGMYEWMHDSEIASNFQYPMEKTTMEEVIEFIENNKEFPKDRSRLKNSQSINLAIDLDGEYMGTISLKHIDLNSNNAEYAISIRKCAQGQGLGRRASRELIELAFYKYGLNKIYLNVLAQNKIAQLLYESLGFVREGYSKQHVFINGTYRDLIWYGLLKEEYDNR